MVSRNSPDFDPPHTLACVLSGRIIAIGARTRRPDRERKDPARGFHLALNLA